MAREKKARFEEVDMDMTPMIDVTFLLLIFFLCLEFKTLESKLAANLPKDVGPQEREAVAPIDKLDVRIQQVVWGTEVPDPSGRDRFDLVGHRVQWYVGPQPIRRKEGLASLLQREVKRRVVDPKTLESGPRPITVKTGPGVTYGDVTWLIDQARDAGFETITFGGAGGTRRAEYR